MVTYKYNKNLPFKLTVELDESIDLDYYYELREEMAYNMCEQIKYGITWFN